jgi:hypothetical protein
MAGRTGTRGNELLLAHCEALDALENEQSASFERLACAVGDELARLLVFALADEPGRGAPGANVS